MAIDSKSYPHVVVVGGGFAGLNVVKSLRRGPVRITLLDRRNYHLFQPLLYQVATAGLNPSDIAYPLRSALRKQSNVTVLLAEAKRVDVARSEIELDNGKLGYDYLVVATGATHSYFGHDEWMESAPGLKTIEDALEMRRRIYVAYEAAEREMDPVKRRSWLTFVVVGGGPTGVELAGALAEIGRQTLLRDFRSIDPSEVRVILVEAGERILSTYPVGLSMKAEKQLKELGVEVRQQAPASDISSDRLVVAGEELQTRTILWAAGVRASSLVETIGADLDRAGRVKVEPDLSIPGHSNVFVCGDTATVKMEEGFVPGVSPAAIQQGKHVAKNILARIGGLGGQPFRYVDKGSLATIGRGRAIADVGRVQASGFPAWVAWLLIHIFYLIGFRNRLWVLSGWAWSYLTYQRGARLITGKTNLADLPRLSDTRSQA